jgi:hypothetical protein
VIEKALSHEKQGIRAVYILAEHAAERKKMLQWWANYVDAIVNESKVIVGNFGVSLSVSALVVAALPTRIHRRECSR